MSRPISKIVKVFSSHLVRWPFFSFVFLTSCLYLLVVRILLDTLNKASFIQHSKTLSSGLQRSPIDTNLCELLGNQSTIKKLSIRIYSSLGKVTCEWRNSGSLFPVFDNFVFDKKSGLPIPEEGIYEKKFGQYAFLGPIITSTEEEFFLEIAAKFSLWKGLGFPNYFHSSFISVSIFFLLFLCLYLVIYFKQFYPLDKIVSKLMNDDFKEGHLKFFFDDETYAIRKLYKRFKKKNKGHFNLLIEHYEQINQIVHLNKSAACIMKENGELFIFNQQFETLFEDFFTKSQKQSSNFFYFMRDDRFKNFIEKIIFEKRKEIVLEKLVIDGHEKKMEGFYLNLPSTKESEKMNGVFFIIF